MIKSFFWGFLSSLSLSLSLSLPLPLSLVKK